MKKHRAYLELGSESICLDFSCSRFAVQARQHIFLSENFEGQTVGNIEYIEDDSVSQLIRVPCKPNVVHITREDMGNGQYRIVLRMFDKHTIALDIQEDSVRIHYPSDAPIRLMLDDVLQAALQPILDRLGGFILHGSCVAHDGSAIVFMGNSGSGKSTTAFNLIRFGLHCYADDAVMVTPVDGDLWVWPLAREFSIRPLTFRLFREHGVQIQGYKKDGEKYYFSQGPEKYSGAHLRYICFVEVSGEYETLISYLNPEQTLQILLRENRHFSFLGRQSAEVYSKIISEKVPMAFSASVGMDLDSQGKMLREVVIGRVLPSKEKCATTGFHASRKHKMDLVRRAWSNTGKEPLEELIPLLGDFDLKVFTLALGFFQTYPFAHIEPVGLPSANSMIPQSFEASWLRAASWVEGCRELVLRTDVEVLERFAIAWIKSAPFIYPFLSSLTSSDYEKYEQIEKAWKRYQEESIKHRDRTTKSIGIRMSDIQGVSVQPNLMSHNSWSSIPHSEEKITHIFFWIIQGEPLSRQDMDAFFEYIGEMPLFTVVPVALKNREIFTTPVEFMRFARECGFKPKLFRSFPLCQLGDEDAHFLINAGAFENRIQEGEVRRPDINAFWLEKPYPTCNSCGLYLLGLCRGGFFYNME